MILPNSGVAKKNWWLLCVSSRVCLWSLVFKTNEFRLKGFISNEEINLSWQNKISDLALNFNKLSGFRGVDSMILIKFKKFLYGTI